MVSEGARPWGRARSGDCDLCESTVAGPAAQRDNVLVSKCEYPFPLPSLLNLLVGYDARHLLESPESPKIGQK